MMACTCRYNKALYIPGPFKSMKIIFWWQVEWKESRFKMTQNDICGNMLMT